MATSAFSGKSLIKAAGTPRSAPLHDRFAAAFYGSSSTRNESGGTLSNTVESYVARRVNKFNFRGDSENVLKARQEGERIRAWAEKHQISPRDLQTALAVQLEREEAQEREPQTQEHLTARATATQEALRLEHGSTEAAQAHVQRYVALTTTLAQELPELAARANANGAGVDVRVVRALGHYDAPK